MGFLDDVKKGASNLGNSINTSVSGQQTSHRVSNLLHDLGALTWAAKIGQAGPDDATEWARIEAELTEIATAGGAVDVSLKTGATPPPPPPPAAADARDPAPSSGRGRCAGPAPSSRRRPAPAAAAPPRPPLRPASSCRRPAGRLLHPRRSLGVVPAVRGGVSAGAGSSPRILSSTGRAARIRSSSSGSSVAS